MNPTPWYRWDEGDLLLQIRVQPRASRDGIVGPHGNELKVRITAPPVDGEANAHLTKFLAKAFGVARAAVRLESGESGRSKRLRICKPQHLPDAAEIGPENAPK